MKKHYGQIIFAGILPALIFRDHGPGYILGFLYGIGIGVPLYFLLHSLSINPHKEKQFEIVARAFCIIILFLIFWITYHPPAPILFKRLISKSIPESVNHLKSTSSIDGPTDCSHYIVFNINRDDLDNIVQSKKLIPASITAKQLEGTIRYELTPSNYSTSFFIDLDRTPLTLSSFNEAEAFVMKDREKYFREYLLYNPITNEALYIYYN